MTAHLGSDTFGTDEPAPCDDCGLNVVCALHHLACQAFSNYVEGRDWVDIVRMPNALTYKFLYRAYTPEQYERLEQHLTQLRALKAANMAARGTRAGRKPTVRRPEEALAC